MTLIKFDFAKENTLSAIWQMKESEEELLKICSLTKYDQELLESISSMQRRIEILTVRTLLNFLNPNLTITYNDRKPVCNHGCISISHSDTFVAVIWHPTNKTTIDIEHINDKIKRIAKRAFNENELNFAKDNTELLTKIWSCKECVYKLANTLNIDFKKQIFVSEFDENCNIECKLHTNSKEYTYCFKHTKIQGHVLIWGVK